MLGLLDYIQMSHTFAWLSLDNGHPFPFKNLRTKKPFHQCTHKKPIPFLHFLHKFSTNSGPFGRLRRHLSVEKSYGLVSEDQNLHQQDPFTSQRFAPPRRYAGSSDHLPGMMLAMGAPSMLPSYQQQQHFGMHYGTEGRKMKQSQAL